MEVLDCLPALSYEHPVVLSIAPLTIPATAAATTNDFVFLFMFLILF